MKGGTGDREEEEEEEEEREKEGNPEIFILLCSVESSVVGRRRRV